jgi:hypothetical protein
MNPATPTIRAHTRGDTTRHDKSIRVRGNSTADGLSDAPSIPHQQSGTEEKTASLEKSAKPHGRKTEAASSIASIGEDSPSESKIEASDGASGPAGNEMLLLGYPALNSLDGADIPDYIKEHNATLTFPEMVRPKETANCICLFSTRGRLSLLLLFLLCKYRSSC